MSDRICERWAELADASAVGDPISAAEANFLADHERSCRACAAETAAWDGLRVVLSVPDGEAATHRPAIDRVLDRARRARQARRYAVAAGTVVLAAAAALVLVPLRGGELTPEARPSARILRVSGATEMGGEPAAAAGPVRQGALIATHDGTLCLVMEPAPVRLCLGPASTARVASLGPGRRVELLVGKLVAQIEPQPPGTRFSVETTRGTVTAVGTAFSVLVSPSGEPVVTGVLEGTVEVRQASSGKRTLRAREIALLRPGVTEVRGASAEEEAADWGLLAAALPSGPSIVPVGPVAGAPPPPDETSESIAREEAEPGTTAPTKSPASPRPAAGTTAAELLERAREHRAAGQHAEAVRVYRRLQAQHAGSEEAHTSLVSLGDVQLSALGDARGALRSFDTYLERGGSLRQEASYGRIRALGALGEQREEARAIEFFLRAHPRSVQVKVLRGRLSSLRGDGDVGVE